MKSAENLGALVAEMAAETVAETINEIKEAERYDAERRRARIGVHRQRIYLSDISKGSAGNAAGRKNFIEAHR